MRVTGRWLLATPRMSPYFVNYFVIYFSLGGEGIKRARMKPAYWAGLLLASATVGGCSWLTDLVILNSTKEAISLVYVLKLHDLAQTDPETGVRKGYLLNRPRLIPIDKFDKRPDDYPEASHTFDKKTGAVVVSVPPGSAVWVDTISNYSAQWYRERASYLNISKLTIQKKGGAISWEGIELMKAFKKYRFGPMQDSLYVIEVE